MFYPRKLLIVTHTVRRRVLRPLLIICAFALVAKFAPAQPAQQIRLAKIDVVGLRQMTTEKFVAASGLQIGQQVDVPTLDAAAQRLLDTGLFTKLSYRYRVTGAGAVVTFIIEETQASSLPVVFDNFIWFSRDELLTAVRRELPAFDGTAPDTQGATTAITKALNDLLAARHIAGQVEYTLGTDERGGHPRHVFTIKGVHMPVCKLHFPGATDVSEGELSKNSQPLFEMDYSQENVATFAASNLIPLYRQRGHLRASFAAPSATVVDASAPANCKGGADVTVPVSEGLIYLWDKAEWTDAGALAAPELDAALNMKAGEVADGLKLDKGWQAVQRAYGHKGYLDARVKPVATFDDEQKRVSYVVQLTQGAQYHMGAFNVAGLPEADAARVRAAWQLALGAVYDADYLLEFMKKLPALHIQGFGTKFRQTGAELKPDRQKQTVDVTLTFK